MINGAIKLIAPSDSGHLTPKGHNMLCPHREYLIVASG